MSQDLVDRDDISDGAVLKELESRFHKNDIYSNIGPIIIAVNPYKNITELYSAERLTKLIDDNITTSEVIYMDSDPHVWNVARSSYNQLTVQKTRQAIVISGESGGTSTSIG